MKKFLLILALACVTCLTRAASVTLEWEANPESDLAGYVLAYGTSSAQWITSGELPAFELPLIPVATLAGTFTGLQAGTTYHFSLKARNVFGPESDWADVITYTVPLNPPSKPARLRITTVTIP